MRLHYYRLLVAALFALILIPGAVGQTRKKRAAVKKPAAEVAAKPTPMPEVIEPAKPEPPKKNERPGVVVTPAVETHAKTLSGIFYRYEFTQPEFVVSKITIEHDESGKGTINFVKRGNDDAVISDPLVVSAAVLDKINGAYTALHFLDSRESYQFEKDFSHLGNMTFTLRRADKERIAAFNYTQNKDAKTLADEYRKLGNQYIWLFDITVARENQPLDAPRLLDALDSYMKRNEISDNEQMTGILQGLSDDERIPLIARNHALRLIKKIEKEKK